LIQTFLLWTFHVNGAMQYVEFGGWLLSLSIGLSKIIHVYMSL
jgi:hypothetical protein